MIPSDSSSREIRRPAGSNAIPAASYSGWYQRPDAKLEPSARDQVQARGLVRQDGRMAEVVGQHHRAHPQPRGHGRRGGQRGEWRQLRPERPGREMIPQQQHVDPGILDLPCELKPGPPFWHRLADNPDPQPRHDPPLQSVGRFARLADCPRPYRKALAGRAGEEVHARPGNSGVIPRTRIRGLSRISGPYHRFSIQELRQTGQDSLIFRDKAAPPVTSPGLVRHDHLPEADEYAVSSGFWG